MAITKEYLNQDWDTLVSFLSNSGVFTNVTHESNIITCKDSDNNTVFTIDHSSSSVVYTAYASTLVYKAVTISSSPKPMYGYKCNNGILLWFGSSSNKFYVLFSSTNQNKIAVVMSSTSNTAIESASKIYYCICIGDVEPFSTDEFKPREKNQTQIVSFTSNNDANTVSYTPNAGYLAVAQYYGMGMGILTIGGVDYLTNGYWVIKDE